ncbi:MAG TPA: glycoside hydrolase family 76 protein [Polyangia bacterium]
MTCTRALRLLLLTAAACHGAAHAPSTVGDAADMEIGADSDAPADLAATSSDLAGGVDGGLAIDPGPGGDFRAYADGAAAALQQLYSASTGLFPSTGWWNSANALTALIDYSIATQSSAYVGDIANTFDHNSSAKFLNDYYDDEGWWALAWIRAWDLTKQARYLDMAKTIFDDMAGGWDATCNGGIWWSKARTYKNAIANELFLEVAIRLHQRTPGDAGAGSYLDWATREWSWFDKSKMINGNDLVNDGLTAGCANNGGTTWTYNQGVIIGGLVDLAAVTNDAGLTARATAIARASTAKLVDGNGVLRESCEPSCGGDGPQFKGILMRHLAELQKSTGDAPLRRFLAANADWIWNADRNGQNQLGLSWRGPFDSADAARQSSALDALNAAIPFSAPEKNLALSKMATANGGCAAEQTAAHAFDGLVSTKWCAGATNGAYWLEVDLGAVVDVGRVIVRHASAGGENAAWNTRDFTLAIVDDLGAASTVAKVSGNTQGVTIHRFAPAAARKVRLDISSAQTDPMTVAARIYELEVFAR